MKPYEILEHTADLKIRAFGEAKEKLFSNMLAAVFDCLNAKLKMQNAKRIIKIKSIDPESLLVDFLSEALYLSQVNKEAYFEAKIDKLTDKELEGELIGQKVDGFEEEIKAVTYHDLEIKKVNDHWQAVVLFDV